MNCDDCVWRMDQWETGYISQTSTGGVTRKSYCNNPNSVLYTLPVKNLAKCDIKNKEKMHERKEIYRRTVK